MLEASSDNRGTLQQLAEDLDEVYADGTLCILTVELAVH